MRNLEQGADLDADRVSELVLRWEEGRERGVDLSIKDLCDGNPELEAELERRIEILRYWDGLTETDDGHLGWRSAAPQQAPALAAITLTLTDLTFHAQGGLGAVFKASDAQLGRTLALKLPRGDGEDGTEKERNGRLLREVKVTAALEHPGIVPVYGLGQDASGRLCYAMRFITGKTLKDAIAEFHLNRAARRPRERSPIRRDAGFRALMRRFRSACMTVAYAHSRGFLHRDLKPEHILLGDFDVTLVVDWGLTARHHDREQNQAVDPGAEPPSLGEDLATDQGIGTLGFASPEQQAGDWKRVGPASDVFSLGATLYTLVTGRLPFPGSSVADIMNRVENGKLAPPRQVNPEIPLPLNAICLKALARQPEDRYGSAQALADDLERWLADVPVAAYTEPFRDRSRRWIGRHRLALFMLLAATIGGLCVAMGSLHRLMLAEVENRSGAYVAAEMAAMELLRERRPNWVADGLDQIRKTGQIATSLRSDPNLRSLAATCLTGVDLLARGTLSGLSVGDLAFSPDGNLIALGEKDHDGANRLQIVDATSGKVVLEYAIPTSSTSSRRSGFTDLAFSPDGRWLVAGEFAGEILIWNLGDRAPRPHRLARHPDRLAGAGFTPDGLTLVLGLREGDLHLFGLSADGNWTHQTAISLGQGLRDLAISRDGTRVTCAGRLGVTTYELALLRKRVISAEPGPSRFPAPADGVDIGPDDHALAVAYGGSRTLAIETRTSRESLVDPDLGVAHRSEICQFSFSPDGTMAVSGSGDNTVKLWDTSSMRLLHSVSVYSESCVRPVFHPGGRLLAVATTEGVSLYELHMGEIATTHAWSPGILTDFMFRDSKAGARPSDVVVVRSQGGTSAARRLAVESWNRGRIDATRFVPLAFPLPIEERLPKLHITTAQHNLVLEQEQTLQCVQLADPNDAAALRLMDRTTALCIDPDGTKGWIALNHGSILSVRLPDLAILSRWEFHSQGTARTNSRITSLSAGRSWVVAGTQAGDVLVLRAGDGQLDHASHADSLVQAVALSPDESTVVCGTQRGGLHTFPTRESPFLRSNRQGEMVTTVAFHPSGRYIATDSRNRHVTLWKRDPSGLTELLNLELPFGRSALAIRFSSDGRYLGVLAPNERAVRVWDLETLRKHLRDLGLDWRDDEPFLATAAVRGMP